MPKTEVSTQEEKGLRWKGEGRGAAVCTFCVEALLLTSAW